ncbi:MAG: hypothetical protein IJU37_11845, partial [Desulfovibrio sp.]|nr:hypothetical protein [Desulfovibrio sp.]
MHEDYTAAIDAVFGPQSAPQPTHDALPAEDYSAAIDSVFGPMTPETFPQGMSKASPSIPAGNAVDTSSGIANALDAQPGTMEQQTRQAFTPASTADQQPPVTPAEPEIDLADPTAGWYAPPTKQAPAAPNDDFHDDSRRFDTFAVRALMAERVVLRHQLLPEGQDDAGQGALIRASFMLNNASRYKQDDVYTAITASAALGLPLDMTLDSLPKA